MNSSGCGAYTSEKEDGLEEGASLKEEVIQ